MSDARSKHLLFSVITAGLSIGVVLAGAEILLRASGREPWQPLFIDPAQPVIYRPDPVLGWKHTEGEYRFPAFSPLGKGVRMRFEPDGSRSTGARSGTGDGTIAIVGGSFTEGFAIADHETFAWKLQERFPSMRVRNYGHGGYGTYQSLLLLEQVLSQRPAPVMMLYGFYEGHEIRNVATADWLEMLSMMARRHSTISVPYAALGDDGVIVRHRPASYPLWPLHQHSATITFLQHGYARLAARRRTSQRAAVTEQLLLQMQSASEASGTDFVVVFLFMNAENKARYSELLRSHDVAFADCARPLLPAFQVPADGHPNEKLNAVWADCIAEAIGGRLERLDPKGSGALSAAEIPLSGGISAASR
jgi:hypothetical protein